MQHVLLKEKGKGGVGDDGLPDEFSLEGRRILQVLWLLIHVSPVGLNEVIDNLLPEIRRNLLVLLQPFRQKPDLVPTSTHFLQQLKVAILLPPKNDIHLFDDDRDGYGRHDD